MALLVGCRGGERMDFVYADRMRISLDEAVKAAEVQAAKVVAEKPPALIPPDSRTAGDPHWVFQQKQWQAEDSLLTLADYEKTIQVHTEEGRPALLANYSCQKAAHLGGKAHFGVMVFLDNGQTRVLKGTGQGP